MVTDPISELIIKIKNGNNAGLDMISLPHSNLKEAVANLLEKEGFIGSIAKKRRKAQKLMEIALVYEGKKPRINGVERISKPSRRLYWSVRQIRPFKNGYGIYVFSTPKGILSDREAKKQNVGGEILFKIW